VLFAWSLSLFPQVTGISVAGSIPGSSILAVVSELSVANSFVYAACTRPGAISRRTDVEL
jgi:hypothetical protein